jgi:hypothetical protein
MTQPVVYEAEDPMPDEYREVLIRLLRVHADTEASVIFPETDWIRDHLTFAPTAEDRVIEASIYADESATGSSSPDSCARSASRSAPSISVAPAGGRKPRRCSGRGIRLRWTCSAARARAGWSATSPGV